MIIVILFARPETGSAEEEIKSDSFINRYHIRNSVQAGLEYDSNVYKTFNQNVGDGLTRLLLKSSGDIPSTEHFSLGWRYEGGGKIFFQESPQNTLIQYFDLPMLWRIGRYVSIGWVPDLKYQNERNELDQATPPLDVNEDYWSTTSRLTGRISLPGDFYLNPFGEFTYYNFGPIPDYSFYRENGGVSIQRHLGESFAGGLEYGFTAQQFRESSREDKEHAVAGFFQYLGTPFVSLRYQYEKSNSNQSIYDYSNHRITLLVSFPIGEKENLEPTDDGEPAALFAFHLLGNIQIKRFPEVFDFTQEGQRFLLTGAEDDNFNSMVVKLTAHPWKRTAMEAKYTRYSNEFSEESQNQQNEFRRSLYYFGLRVSF